MASNGNKRRVALTNRNDDLQLITDALAALGKHEGAKEGVAVVELSARTGWTDEVVRHKLKLLLDAGRLNVSHRIERNIAGHPKRVPVYKVKE